MAITDFSPIQSILLQPLVPATALLAHYARPEQTQRYISIATADLISAGTVLTALKASLIFGVIYRINRTLNRLALNNYTSDPTWDWSREIVLITGGSSGIGREVVRQLSERGITTVSVDVNPPPPPQAPAKASTTNEPSASKPTKTHHYTLDLASPPAIIQQTTQKIIAEVGHPTVLINNAGVGSGKTILNETPAEWQRVLDVNLTSHFLLIKEFLPEMIRRNHGHIVGVASMASFVSVAGNASYSATKIGVLALHEALSREVWTREGASRVRFSTIHPLWTRTAMIAPLQRSSSWQRRQPPIMEVDYVAGQIVSQILSGQGAQVILPRYVAVASLLRGFPNWIQEALRAGDADVVSPEN